MARRLKNWPKNVDKRGRKPGPTVSYDWDLWLNGEIWKLRKGVDFEVNTRSIQNAAHIAAKRRGMLCKTAVLKGEDAVVLQKIADLNNTRHLRAV